MAIPFSMLYYIYINLIFMNYLSMVKNDVEFYVIVFVDIHKLI